jgi:hypothetical protein
MEAASAVVRDRGRTPRLLLALLFVAAAFILVYVRGLELSLDTGATERLRFHAIPVALSWVYHGHPYDYTGIRTIAHMAQNPALSDGDDLIRWALSRKFTEGDGVYFWAADDRGLSDFVGLAFKLFGPRINSLYSFYFLLLGATCLLWLLAYRGSPPMLGLLGLLLLGYYSALPPIALAQGVGLQVTDAAWLVSSVGIFESRAFDLLAMPAALHLALLPFVPGVRGRLAITATFGQAIVLAFCYHMRSSVGWEIAAAVAIILVGLLWALVARMAKTNAPVNTAHAGVALLCMVVALTAFSAHRYAHLHPTYFSDLGARTVWHNMLMGLGLSATLQKRYGFGVDDFVIASAVVTYGRDVRGLPLGKDRDPQNIMNSLGGHASFDWVAYERVARSLFKHIVVGYPAEVAHAWFVQKPRIVASIFAHTILPSENPAIEAIRAERRIYFNPLAPPMFAMLVVWLVIFLPTIGRHELGAWGLAMAVLLPASLVPAVVFYPAVLTLCGTFLLASLLVYSVLALVVATIHRRLAGRTVRLAH